MSYSTSNRSINSVRRSSRVSVTTLILSACILPFCQAFLPSPLLSTTTSRRPSLSPSISLQCHLPKPLTTRVGRGYGVSDRQKLTRRAFQASEVVAKPPHIDQTFRPAADRVVAMGDVHGDLFALDTALTVSGLMDSEGQWAGGKAVLVQMGDILDRGPDESECLERLLGLQQGAREAGGDVIMLLGNHEIMNADLDFRYVEPLGWLGWDDSEDVERAMMTRNGKKRTVPTYMLPRIQALQRGKGALAEALAKMPVAVTIGTTVFCHGGLVPEVVSYGLRRLNEETASWLRGESASKPSILENCKVHGAPVSEEKSPLWHRGVGRDDVCDDSLAEVDASMRLLGATRLVVGHTPQARGINCVETHDGREIWRVDTGMSEGILNGRIETLEIRLDKHGHERVHVLDSEGIMPALDRLAQRGNTPSWKRQEQQPLLTVP